MTLQMGTTLSTWSLQGVVEVEVILVAVVVLVDTEQILVIL
tara:strand:+ start:46 stop:168 length:123 start_codon:yes stop_codon:yes gene_type:complete